MSPLAKLNHNDNDVLVSSSHRADDITGITRERRCECLYVMFVSHLLHTNSCDKKIPQVGILIISFFGVEDISGFLYLQGKDSLSNVTQNKVLQMTLILNGLCKVKTFPKIPKQLNRVHSTHPPPRYKLLFGNPSLTRTEHSNHND